MPCPYEKMKQKIISIFETALANKKKYGVDYLFLSGLLRSQKGVSLFEGKIDSVEVAVEIKIGVWVGCNGHWGSASLESVDEKKISAAILKAKEVSRFLDPDPAFDLSEPASKQVVFNQIDLTIPSLSLDQLEEITLIMEGRAKNFSPLIKNVPHVVCGYDHSTRIVANSKDVMVVEENAQMGGSLSVTAQGSDGRLVNCYDGKRVTHFKDFVPTTVVNAVATEAVGRTCPQKVFTGLWPIIFSPRTTAQLLMNFWSIFSGDFAYRKMTRFQGQLGEIVMAPAFSIVDEGPFGLVPHSYDAEGSLVQNRSLIQDGILQGFCHNIYTANKCGVHTTGNASGGLESAPQVSAANLKFTGKTTPVSQMMTTMGKGILITELHGSAASPISGEFSYGALGYWIENGQKIYPIADFTIAGNFFDLLKNIEALGDDADYFFPHLFGSYGGASLLVNQLAVSGQ